MKPGIVWARRLILLGGTSILMAMVLAPGTAIPCGDGEAARAGPVRSPTKRESDSAYLTDLVEKLRRRTLTWALELTEANSLASSLGMKPTRVMLRADDPFASTPRRPSLKLEGYSALPAAQLAAGPHGTKRYKILSVRDGGPGAKPGCRVVEVTW